MLERATSPSPCLRWSFRGWSSISDIPYAAKQRRRCLQYSDVGQHAQYSETSVLTLAWRAKFDAECLRTPSHLGAKGGLFAEPLTLVKSRPLNDAKVVHDQLVMDVCTGVRGCRRMARRCRITRSRSGGGLIRCHAQRGLARDLSQSRTVSYRGVLHSAALTAMHIAVACCKLLLLCRRIAFTGVVSSSPMSKGRVVSAYARDLRQPGGIGVD